MFNYVILSPFREYHMIKNYMPFIDYIKQYDSSIDSYHFENNHKINRQIDEICLAHGKERYFYIKMKHSKRVISCDKFFQDIIIEYFQLDIDFIQNVIGYFLNKANEYGLFNARFYREYCIKHAQPIESLKFAHTMVFSPLNRDISGGKISKNQKQMMKGILSVVELEKDLKLVYELYLPIYERKSIKVIIEKERDGHEIIRLGELGCHDFYNEHIKKISDGSQALAFELIDSTLENRLRANISRHLKKPLKEIHKLSLDNVLAYLMLCEVESL